MMEGEKDLFAAWAAVEFLAAGRAHAAEKRRRHRRQAEFFADVLHELHCEQAVRAAQPKTDVEIGRLLRLAFGSDRR